MRLPKNPACAAIALVLSFAIPVAGWAQQPHHALRGDMPPGEIAHKRIIGNPQLARAMQPVRVVTPLGASVSVYSMQGFFDTGINTTTVGLRIGPVYRLRISNIPGHPGKEIYPSIELMDHLRPPAGLGNQFPVEVVINNDDLKLAASGRMLTKVVYLEDPRTALPYRKIKDEQPYFDVGPGQDPLNVSRRLGRPIAIVRIGSRVPLFSDTPGEFEFNSPEVQLLPDSVSEENRNLQFDKFQEREAAPSGSDMLPVPNNPPNANPLPVPSDQNTGLPNVAPIGGSDDAQRLMKQQIDRVEKAGYVEPPKPKIDPPTPAKMPTQDMQAFNQMGIVRFVQDDTTVPGILLPNPQTQIDAIGPAPGAPIVRDPNREVTPTGDAANDFPTRATEPVPGQQVYPVPMGRKIEAADNRGVRRQFQQDEFIFDGDDRGKRVTVDQSWAIHGMDSEDTFAHFDTLDGQRLVSPSNRVSIYSPRFGSVRSLSPISNQMAIQSMTAAEDKMQMLQANGKDFSSTTKQNEMVLRNRATQRASSFRDRTRGLRAETTLRIVGFRNRFSPYENLSLIRIGRFSKAEGPRLGLGIQSAKVWSDEAGLQVTVNNAQAIVVRDASRVQEIEAIETEADNAVLRVVKLASRIAAKSGEEVEFTIRFDNLSKKMVGNVTMIDNLTSRLEYVDGSAESTLEANFVSKRNDAGSLTLRWEIVEPLPAGEGGVIRFKCRVR